MDTTEVRIPLYDRNWNSLKDVTATLEHIASELLAERYTADSIFIEIQWEQTAREDKEFMEMVNQYSPKQFWLRFERM